MSADTRGVSPEALTEAAALAAYATDDLFTPSLESIERGLDDRFVSNAIVAVAEHVCGLRRRQASAPGPAENGSDRANRRGPLYPNPLRTQPRFDAGHGA